MSILIIMSLKRKIIYSTLVNAEAYLPPLNDRSLTVLKLQQMESFVTVAPRIQNITEKKFRSDARKCDIVNAIVREAKIQMPFWFESGRLPNRNYLLVVLHSYNPRHPLLSRSIHKSRKQRIKKINLNCKACVRHDRRKKPLKAPTPEAANQLPRAIVPFRDDENELNYAHRIISSRHELVALHRNATIQKLEDCKFFDPCFQHDLLKRIKYIDRIADEIMALRFN